MSDLDYLKERNRSSVPDPRMQPECDCGLHHQVNDVKQRVDRLVRQMESLLYAQLPAAVGAIDKNSWWNRYQYMLDKLEKK